MKRLFFAVDIDEATRRQVAAIASRMQSALGDATAIRWVSVERLHLTLAFFGAADERLERQLLDVLRSPFAEPPFDIAFAGLGRFPPRGSPRVLWLGLSIGGASLHRLRSALTARIALASGADEPFTPHLTLARVRDRVPALALGVLNGMSAAAGPSRIDRVTLYESRRSPSGATYVPRAEALLQP